MIYVEQYGAFWSLSERAWRRACADGATNREFDFDELGTRLTRRPPWIYKGTRHYDQHTVYHGTHPKHRVYSPLDWDQDDWYDALKDCKGELT